MPSPAAPIRRVLLVDRLRDPLAAWLAERRPDLECRTRERGGVAPEDVAWADAYVGFAPPPPPTRLDGVAWVHAIGAGVDGFTFRYPLPAETLLTRTSEPFGPQIAEYCVARALAERQGLAALAAAQRERRWSDHRPRPLRGDRVLIVGTGEVGRGVASAFAGLGAEPHGVSRSGRPVAPFASVRPTAALAQAVADAAWIVLAAPLTEASHRLCGADVLARCRGAFLMNVSRGGLLDSAALLDALREGRLRGAALDVFDVEPLPEDSPLWEAPGLQVSPHVAGLTTVEGAGAGFLAALEALERGETPATAVPRDRGY